MNPQSELEHWQSHLQEAILKTTCRPMIVRVYRETRSTQDVAKTFAPKPALVVAEQQTAGRGRLGRKWVSSPGASVLMSLCWPVAEMPASHDRISMLVGVALAQATAALIPDAEVRLKWPNDVMVDGRKLAGILIEATEHAYIIGIGINLTHASITAPPLSQTATCLQAHGCPDDPLLVIERSICGLIRALQSNSHDETLRHWRLLATLGQTQTFEQAGQLVKGQVIDLDPDHGLVVRRDSGEITTLPAATTSVVS